jgi:hypothetical protein
MPSYRITKYDPALRDADGAFPGPDWTSVSDVGSAAGVQGILTMDEYLAVESAYLESVRRIMGAVGVNELRATDVDTRARSHGQLDEGQILSGPALDDAMRACLREEQWCRLQGEGGFFVHFGYDFYMYVGFTRTLTLPELPRGIFAEASESPYLRLE